MTLLSDILLQVIEKYGEHHTVFRHLVYGKEQTVTAIDFLKHSNHVAAYLQSKKLQLGNIVVSIFPNSPEWHYVERGITLTGMVHVPLAYHLSSEDIARVIGITKPALVLVSSKVKKKQLEKLSQELNSRSEIIVFSDIVSTVTKYPLSPPRNVSETDTAVILFTSGSTGEPKGVCLSHKNLLSAITEFSNVSFFNGCSNALSLLPIQFSAERKLSYCYLLRGLTICFPPPTYSIALCIEHFKIEFLAMVPFLLKKLCDELEQTNIIPHQLTVVCGGAPLYPNLAMAAKKHRINVYEVYGLTETASLLSYNTPENNQPGTTGKPSPSMSLAFSNEGEILVKGKNVMKGYFNQQKFYGFDGTAEWFATGDKGEIDELGYLKIKGRIKNEFKTQRGEFVYPEKLESLVAEVLQISHVVCFPNETGICAIVFLPELSSDEATKQTLINLNKQLPESERLSGFIVVKRSIDFGLHTSTYKVNRNAAIQKFGNEPAVSLI